MHHRVTDTATTSPMTMASTSAAPSGPLSSSNASQLYRPQAYQEPHQNNINTNNNNANHADPPPAHCSSRSNRSQGITVSTVIAPPSSHQYPAIAPLILVRPPRNENSNNLSGIGEPVQTRNRYRIQRRLERCRLSVVAAANTGTAAMISANVADNVAVEFAGVIAASDPALRF